MLLINGVIAALGMALAFLLYQVHLLTGIEGLGLIAVGAVFFWFYLFVSDIIEDYLIEQFNKDPSE